MKTQINIRDYDLIVFDVDGTIMDSSHRLHPFTCDVINRLQKFFIPYTLATGKNLPATQAAADALNVDLPLIVSNGSMLQMRDGQVIEKNLLPAEITRWIIHICEKNGFDLALYVDDDVYIPCMNFNFQLLIEYGSPQLTEIGGWESLTKCIHEVHKCLVVDRQSRENLFLLERLYRRAIGDMVEYCHTLNEMLEVMPKGVSKLSALRRLTEMLKMDMNRVMAFGDGNNDAEMLKNVGVGIAVENATEFAKTSADLVVPSCDENGPAIFLQDLLKKSHPNQDDRKGEPVILN